MLNHTVAQALPGVVQSGLDGVCPVVVAHVRHSAEIELGRVPNFSRAHDFNFVSNGPQWLPHRPIQVRALGLSETDARFWVVYPLQEVGSTIDQRKQLRVQLGAHLEHASDVVSAHLSFDGLPVQVFLCLEKPRLGGYVRAVRQMHTQDRDSGPEGRTDH
ncbi:MAG: hypothetical protein QM747_17165 [Nocardioides sp.]